MRFFTLDWWQGCQTGDAGDASVNHARHLVAIRARLSADLLAMQESISLHDSRLRKLAVLRPNAYAFNRTLSATAVTM